MTTIMSGSRYLIVSGDTTKFFKVVPVFNEPDEEELVSEPLAAARFVHPSQAQRLIDAKWDKIRALCHNGTIQVGQLDTWQLFWKDAQVATFHFSVRLENKHGR